MQEYSDNSEKEIIGGHSTSTVIKEAGVSLRQLYYWEGLGIIKPKYQRFGSRLLRRYSPQDIALLKHIVKFMNEGYKLRIAAEKGKEERKKEENIVGSFNF